MPDLFVKGEHRRYLHLSVKSSCAKEDLRISSALRGVLRVTSMKSCSGFISVECFVQRFCVLFVVVVVCLLASSCRDEPNPEIEAKKVRDIEAIQNICHQDSDCFVTGCYEHVCRAAPDESICEHRLVVRLERDEDRAALETLISSELTPLEALTLRIGGYAARLWTLSFHASLQQRGRIISELQHIASSGIARVAANSAELSRALAAELIQRGVDDVALVKTQVVGELVEVGIRSGDILSLRDVEAKWAEVGKIASAFWARGELAYDVAYDVVMDPLPALRLWPVDKTTRLYVSQFASLHVKRTDEIELQIVLNETQRTWLAQWIQDIARPLVFIIGARVMTPMLVEAGVRGHKLTVSMPLKSDDVSQQRELEKLEKLSQIKGVLRYEAQATSHAERDLDCHRQHRRTCACVAGHCQWRSHPKYQACLRGQDAVMEESAAEKDHGDSASTTNNE